MCIAAMSAAELAELARHAAGSATQNQDVAMEDYNSVFNGHISVPISHAGGEMDAMAAAILPRCGTVPILYFHRLITHVS